MKRHGQRFASTEAFGLALGLSALEMELIRVKKRLIDKLKRAREKKGLSQRELAVLMGSKQPAIARMESGQVAEVSMDFLLKAAIILEVSVTIRPHKAA